MPNHVNCIGLFMIDWSALELASSPGDGWDAELQKRLEALKIGNLCDKAWPGVDESHQSVHAS